MTCAAFLEVARAAAFSRKCWMKSSVARPAYNGNHSANNDAFPVRLCGSHVTYRFIQDMLANGILTNKDG